MRIFFSTFFVILLLSVGSCRKDFNTVISSGNLTFSKDTIFLDTIFTNISSSTYTFKVYNHSSNDITIPSIRLGKEESSLYRLNIDGLAGKVFQNIDILAHDSLFVFVEVTIDANSVTNPLYTDKIIFESQNQHQEVQLVTLVQDAHFLFPKRDANGIKERIQIGIDANNEPLEVNGYYLIGNTTWTNDKPYVIYGYVAVPPNKTLTINAGSKIHFHENSGIIVGKNATLKVNGTVNSNVVFQGDRLEDAFKQVPGQWGTIWLRAGSKNNLISNAIIKNNEIGILVDSITNLSTPTLHLINTQIYNTTNFGLLGRNTFINAENLVIGNNGQASLACTQGGKYNFIHATIANYWNSSFRQFAAVYINNYFNGGDSNNQTSTAEDLIEANFVNCIIDGNQNIELSLDKNENASFNYMFKNVLLKFNDFSNDFSANPLYDFKNNQLFKNIIFNGDADFKDVTTNQYIIGTKSVAIEQADMQESQQVPLDILGIDRTAKPDLGAYQHIDFKTE